ncbi:MAG TPA: TIM barrel protein [Gemmatales bacterium]|nr:TIM barrel protein [Gemmatales bacterium]HMP58582.1 TIM barrel protein [Gemmatales bacterium]
MSSAGFQPSRRGFVAASAAAIGVCAQGVTAATSQADDQPGAKPGRTPHTRFAVNLEIWWRSLPLLQRVEKVAEYGYPAVEFWPFENKDIPALAKACAQHQIEVAQFTGWGFTPHLNDPKNHDAFVKKITEACQVAHQLQCRRLCIVGGNVTKGLTTEQMHANIAEGLKRAADVAEKEKVTLILEPMNGRKDHPGHSLYGSEAGVRITRQVGSQYVKVLFDLYHNQLAEGDLCGHLREGYDQLGYVQIADTPGRKEPGTGEIFYPRVLRELYELGYRGPVGLELWCSKDEATAAAAVARADVW